MRLDKYLKISRIIKRRTVASEACSNHRVLLNGKLAKSSKEIKVGDELEIIFGDKTYKFRITKIPFGNVTKSDVLDLYEIIGEKENE